MDSISTGQAKKMLNCTNQTVRNLIRDGSIEAVQGDDGRFLVDPESVEAYKRDRDQNPLDAKSGSGKTNKFAKKSTLRKQNSGAIFSQMVTDQLCARPNPDDLYDMLVRSPLPVDEFTLDTWFEPPCGSASLVESTLATVLPDHPGRYWREIRFDLDFYLDVSYAVAHDYCWSKARWWCQVTCDGRVVARSADQLELPGCLQWLERIAERDRLAYQKANPPFNWGEAFEGIAGLIRAVTAKPDPVVDQPEPRPVDDLIKAYGQVRELEVESDRYMAEGLKRIVDDAKKDN